MTKQKKTKRFFYECLYVYWSVYIIIQISRENRTYLFPQVKPSPFFLDPFSGWLMVHYGRMYSYVSVYI